MAVLDLTLEEQKCQEWCWAAVTSGIARFVGAGTPSQEDVVCTMLKNGDCRDTPTPDRCNVPFALDRALAKMCGRSVSIRRVIPFPDIQQQIDELGQPVPIAIEFPESLGVLHYCILTGCAEVTGKQEVVLLDPAHPGGGAIHIAYEDLVSSVALHASWRQSMILNRAEEE